MAELVQLTPTLGINVALIASWQDLPTKETPYLIVTFAACAADWSGALRPMTEEYYGEAREALFQYFAANANGGYALPPPTEGA
jgi:hypothetical protein